MNTDNSNNNKNKTNKKNQIILNEKKTVGSQDNNLHTDNLNRYAQLLRAGAV